MRHSSRISIIALLGFIMGAFGAQIARADSVVINDSGVSPSPVALSNWDDDQITGKYFVGSGATEQEAEATWNWTISAITYTDASGVDHMLSVQSPNHLPGYDDYKPISGDDYEFKLINPTSSTPELQGQFNAPGTYVATLLANATPVGTGSPAAQSVDTTHTLAQQAQADVVDAQQFGPGMSGGITIDPGNSNNWPAAGNAAQARLGAWADGTSVLVIRVNAPNVQGPITVTLKHTNPAAYPKTPDFVGSLWAYNAAAAPFGIPALPVADAPNNFATTLTLAANQPRIFYYVPPNNYWFDYRFAKQALNITLLGGVGQPAIQSIALTLNRPSLMISHGVASNAGNAMVLGTNILAHGSGVNIIYFDYKSYNTSGFDQIAPYLKTAISNELSARRKLGIAATRIDFAGHSMGGCIAKWYAAENGKIYGSPPLLQKLRALGFSQVQWDGTKNAYLRSDNFGLGDFHRVMTIGTPFFGSPWADTLCADGGANSATLANYAILASNGKLGGSGAAVYDLETTSFATSEINRVNVTVPWVPLAGIAFQKPIGVAALSPGLGAIVSVFNANAPAALTQQNSDGVVLVTSGLKDLAYPPLPAHGSTVSNVTHTTELPDLRIAQYVRLNFDLETDVVNGPALWTKGYTWFGANF